MCYYPLPAKYIEKMYEVCPELVIVGKDPYPSAAMGIPFCKPSWTMMANQTISGFHVLNSLGIDPVSHDKLAPPEAIFMSLLDRGIVFLNASYYFLGTGAKFRKRDRYHLHYLEDAYKVNQPVLERSRRTLLCGQAKILCWYGKNIPNYECVVHPTPVNRNSKIEQVSQGWERIWAKDRLQQQLSPTADPVL